MKTRLILSLSHSEHGGQKPDWHSARLTAVEKRLSRPSASLKVVGKRLSWPAESEGGVQKAKLTFSHSESGGHKAKLTFSQSEGGGPKAKLTLNQPECCRQGKDLRNSPPQNVCLPVSLARRCSNRSTELKHSHVGRHKSKHETRARHTKFGDPWTAEYHTIYTHPVSLLRRTLPYKWYSSYSHSVMTTQLGRLSVTWIQNLRRSRVISELNISWYIYVSQVFSEVNERGIY